jgi:hypothetical protein
LAILMDRIPGSGRPSYALDALVARAPMALNSPRSRLTFEFSGCRRQSAGMMG